MYHIITNYDVLRHQVSDYNILDSLQVSQIDFYKQELSIKDSIINLKDNLIANNVNSSEIPINNGIDWTQIIITGISGIIGLLTGFLIK